jgi:hypothetical protein
MRLRAFLVFSFVLVFFSSWSQHLFEDQINVSSGKTEDKRDAIIYLPANYSKTKAYPLVIFTHGMGEAGKNVKKLYKQGLPKVLKNGYRPPFDFIMVAVQRNSFSVAPEWLAGILKDCQKRWKIDARRIYLTGLSAGGWAVYGSQLNFTPAFAKKFAAIVINSGVTQNTKKKHFDWWKQTRTPLWAIVGKLDKGYVGKNAYMVNEINKRVPKLATLTVRPGIGHGGWSDVYSGKVKLNGKNMWEWLYQFKRNTDGTADEIPTTDDTQKPPTAETKNIKVNLYKGQNPYTNSAWNNWDVGAPEGINLKSGKLKYENGSVSSISAVLSSTFRVVDNLANYGGGMAPAAVLRYASYGMEKRTLTITGLSSDKKYNITLFGSRAKRPGNNTIYQIGKVTRTVDTYKNLNEKAVFENIKADANGRIIVTIDKTKLFNYLNGFVITEIN